MQHALYQLKQTIELNKFSLIELNYYNTMSFIGNNQGGRTGSRVDVMCIA